MRQQAATQPNAAPPAPPIQTDPGEVAHVLARQYPPAFAAGVLGRPPATLKTWRNRFWPEISTVLPYTVGEMLTVELAAALASVGINTGDAFAIARTAEGQLQAWLHVFLFEAEGMVLALRLPAKTPTGLWGCSLHKRGEEPAQEAAVELVVDISSIARALLVRVMAETARENAREPAYGTA